MELRKPIVFMNNNLKITVFSKTFHFLWTDGKQFDGVYWLKQLPSEQSRHVSDTNETGEIFKSPRLSPRNHCRSTGVALGMPVSWSAALKIDCVIFLIMVMTIIYSLPHPPRQRSKRKNKKTLSVIKTKTMQRSWHRRKGSASASEGEICSLDFVSNR